MRLATLLLLSLVLLTACRKQERPVVGVVPKGANHAFWQTVQAGAIKASLEYNFDVEWNAPTLEIDAGRQIAILDSMVNRKLAGIAVAPVDRNALVAVVERAAAAGIPVAIFDSGIDTNNRLTYVATDNREGGRMAARKLGELMFGRGKAAYIGFMPGSASTMEREEGFESEMKASFPGITIVQKAYAMADRAKARAATENILAAQPELTGLFADNESSSAGALMALKGRGSTKVRTVMFDANEQLIGELQNRHIDALVVQDPFRMGYEAAKAIGISLEGGTPATRIDLPATLVTRATMQQPDIVQLLRPDIAAWLAKAR